MAGESPPEHPRSPISKFDIEATEHLRTLPPQQWSALVPDLLTWLQDVNWPIFVPVRNVLLLQPADVILPDVRQIYQIRDAEWQEYVFEHLVRRMEMSAQVQMRGCIEEFREKGGERWEEVDEGYGMGESVEEWFVELDRWEKGRVGDL